MSRRALNMVTAALVVVGFGYLVAVAARSLPGQEEEPPMVDVGFTMPEGVQNSIVWLLMALTALGAALMLLGIKRGNPGKRPPVRALYTLAIWLVILLVMFRFAKPAIEEATEIASELGSDGGAPVEPTGSPTATAAAWIVSAVISAAIAAALIRLATIARVTDWTFDRSQPAGADVKRGTVQATPIVRMDGHDPRARVINAYADFESDARTAGLGRIESETPRRHASRVESEVELSRQDLADLSSTFESARYAESEVTEQLADRAESAWARLKARILP